MSPLIVLKEVIGRQKVKNCAPRDDRAPMAFFRNKRLEISSVIRSFSLFEAASVIGPN